MFHLPFVSRALYEASERRCADLETERRLLLNRLAEMSGFRPIYAGADEQGTVQPGAIMGYEPQAAAQQARPAPGQDKDTINTRAPIDEVMGWAETYVRQRAREQGKLKEN